MLVILLRVPAWYALALGCLLGTTRCPTSEDMMVPSFLVETTASCKTCTGLVFGCTRLLAVCMLLDNDIVNLTRGERLDRISLPTHPLTWQAATSTITFA
jgi:hypothetical protein